MKWILHHGCREREVKFMGEERSQNIESREREICVLTWGSYEREAVTPDIIDSSLLRRCEIFLPIMRKHPHFNLRRFDIYELLKWGRFMSEDKQQPFFFVHAHVLQPSYLSVVIKLSQKAAFCFIRLIYSSFTTVFHRWRWRQWPLFVPVCAHWCSDNKSRTKQMVGSSPQPAGLPRPTVNARLHEWRRSARVYKEVRKDYLWFVLPSGSWPGFVDVRETFLHINVV